MVATLADKNERVVVCGAGVIGASVAYFLSQLGVPSILVERAEPACASSGKAGGFLARDWLDDGPCEHLCRRSYQLHAELAERLDGDLGFRSVTTAALSLVGSHGQQSAGKRGRVLSAVPDWVDGNVQRTQVMSGPEETAQVHPKQLTLALVRAAKHCTLRTGTVTGISTDTRGQVTGVQLGSESLPATKVVLAMGPWTGLASRWLPGVPPIMGQLGHSVVLQAQHPLSSHCFFVNHSGPGMDGVPSNPEVFVRPNGEVYVVEGADVVPLPEDPMAVEADAAKCDRLQATAAALSSELASAEVKTRQACFRPLSQDGVPVIGAVPGSPGAFVASGHSCWGILNSLATGEALASLIVTGESPHVDLTPFDPARFRKSRSFAQLRTSHR